MAELARSARLLLLLAFVFFNRDEPVDGGMDDGA